MFSGLWFTNVGSGFVGDTRRDHTRKTEFMILSLPADSPPGPPPLKITKKTQNFRILRFFGSGIGCGGFRHGIFECDFFLS